MQMCQMSKGCSIGWFRTLVQHLEPGVVLEGEAVFSESDLSTHLSFLQSGTVKVHLGADPSASCFFMFVVAIMLLLTT
jgi:hypothetical protein